MRDNKIIVIWGVIVLQQKSPSEHQLAVPLAMCEMAVSLYLHPRSQTSKLFADLIAENIVLLSHVLVTLNFFCSYI